MIDGDTILVRNPNSNTDSAYQIYWKINDARYSRKDTSFRNYRIQKSKVQSYSKFDSKLSDLPLLCTWSVVSTTGVRDQRVATTRHTVDRLEDTGEIGWGVEVISWDLKHLTYVGVLVCNLLGTSQM